MKLIAAFLIFVSVIVIRGDDGDCAKKSNALDELLGDYSVTCYTSVAGQRMRVHLEIKTCREKPSVTFGFPDLDWEKTFEDSADIGIPGASTPLGGVYLRIKIESLPDQKETNLKIQLYVKVLGISSHAVTLSNEKIVNSDCNAIVYWWNSQTSAIQGSVGGGGGLLFLILLGCCCKCCCCSKKNDRGTTFVMQPPPPPVSGQPQVIVNNSMSSQQNMMSPPGYTAMPNVNKKDPYGVPYHKF